MKKSIFFSLIFIVLLHLAVPVAAFQAKAIDAQDMPAVECFHTFHTLWSEAYQSLGDKAFVEYIQTTNRFYKSLTGVDISPSSPGADSDYLQGIRKAQEILLSTQKSSRAAGQKLRGYIFEGDAYTKEGKEAFADFKIAASLAREALDMNGNFTKAEEQYSQEIHKAVSKSGGIPNIGDVVNLLDGALSSLKKYRNDVTALQSGDAATKKIIQLKTFRYIFSGFSSDFHLYWMEHLNALQTTGEQSTQEGRQARAEYEIWKEMMGIGQYFMDGEPILMKRRFWRSWYGLPADFKTDETIRIETQAADAYEKWSSFAGRYEDALGRAIGQGEGEARDKNMADAVSAAREAEYWKKRYDEWQSRLEAGVETEARHAQEAVDEAGLELKRISVESGGGSPQAEEAKTEKMRLENELALKLEALERYQDAKTAFEELEVDRASYEAQSHFQHSP